MNQYKFESYGRALIIAIGTFITVYLMFIIICKTYVSYQENELMELKKKESKMQTKLHQQQIKTLEKQYELYGK